MNDGGGAARAAVGERLFNSIRGLAGWRRQLAAAIAGATASLALPPIHWVICLWPSLALLIVLLGGCRRPRVAAMTGWSFGFGYFLAGLYWVGISFFVDAEKHAMVMPLAIAGLAALLALFTSFGTYLTALTRTTGWRRVLIFSACWLLADWLRSWVFSGFPWNFLGTAWVFSDAMLQSVALGGVWLLTAMTVMAAASSALLVERNVAQGRSGRILLTVVHLLLVAAWLGGTWRLAAAPGPLDRIVEGERLRIVQPAIAQELKWVSELRKEHVLEQMRLTLSDGYDEITQVIWAETAVPYLLSSDEGLRKALGEVVPRDGYLFTGAPRGEGRGEDRRLWNSLHVLDKSGGLVATFDKFHLVPFGEYDPLGKFLPAGIRVATAADFQSGDGIQTWQLNGLPPVSPLICYEIIFPGAVTSPSGPRPEWILNVTNDAWFGNSTGPYQHFANARLRAAEEGIPVVRVANTGISAVIDPYGRIVQTLGLGDRGVLDSPLPKALEGRTPFATIGNLAVCILIALIVLPALLMPREIESSPR